LGRARLSWWGAHYCGKSPWLESGWAPEAHPGWWGDTISWRI